MSIMTLTLTEYLTSSSSQSESYITATQHEFLTLAGTGTLPLDRLALWLSQDRVYAAHAYPRFIGALIAHIPFRGEDGIDSPAEKKNQEILRVLSFCLTNVVREVDFFKETAKNFGMDMEAWLERKDTRDYTAEMARVSQSTTLEEGLVFLWAMEKVYFDAWSYVHKSLQSCPTKSESSLAVEKFAINWSSVEFSDFVKSLANLVDDIQPGSTAWKRGEAAWKRVVELEMKFWPEKGEEISMKIQL